MAEAQKTAQIQRVPGWDVKIEAQVEEHETLKREGKIVSKAQELVWGDNKMAHNALVASPLTGYAIKTMHAHVDLIAPGGKTGMHRHSSEAILLCLEGAGYSIVDGKRHDWSKGDTVVMPAMAWHQHCNASETEPMKYFAVSNWPLTVSEGLGFLETPEFGTHYQK